MRNDIQFWLENWQAIQEPADGVSLYDFGDSRTVMPISADGSWLTRSIAYLHVKGEGKPSLDIIPRGAVANLGGGWWFLGVEIPLGTSRAELYALLDDAKEKLLAGVKEHDKEQAKGQAG